MTTGEKIRQMRMSQGISQHKLAEMIDGGTDQGQISRWELGKSKPYYRNVERLAEIFHCEVMELIGEDGTSSAKHESVDEKVSTLNGALTMKNAKIRELEDSVLELMQQVEDLQKRNQDLANEVDKLRLGGDSKMLQLARQNIKLREILANKLIEDALKEVEVD